MRREDSTQHEVTTEAGEAPSPGAGGNLAACLSKGVAAREAQEVGAALFLDKEKMHTPWGETEEC